MYFSFENIDILETDVVIIEIITVNSVMIIKRRQKKIKGMFWNHPWLGLSNFQTIVDILLK